MDLTIIIVNWNGGDLLRRCLASLRQHTGRQTVQVIVVDNASRDGSSEMVGREFPEFQLINSGGNLGFGRANNLARPYVNAPFVLFLNPDTEVPGDALAKMVKFLKENSQVGALGCKTLYPDGSVHEQGLQNFPSPATEFLKLTLLSSGSHTRFKRFLPYLNPHRSGYASKLYGGCLMLRKDVLDAAGWFDERYFMYAEDVDLCRTVADLGWRLYYLSEAEVLHIAGGVSGQAGSGFSTLMQCESISKLMRKYYGRTGAAAYRLSMFLGAQFRLAMLLILRLFVSAERRVDNTASLRKYATIVQWTLGLRKAMPPS